MPQTQAAPPRSSPKIAMPAGNLAQSDPEIARFIDLEVNRQRHGLELIASENFVSPAVLEAMGTPLTNKYAEGLPGKRYYGGCEFVDMVEQCAIDRVKTLFAADHANVQPHSGAQANAAVYLAFIFGGYALADNSAILLGWTVAAAAASSVLIVWLAILNFFYLMTQMVVAIEDVSVRAGVRMALTFVWGHLREVAAVFGVVLVMVVIATAASILATAGLGLIAFVPLVGLAVLPLQLAAWLIRGIVFEYLALAALGAYLSHYRWYHYSAPARDLADIRLA